MKHRLTYKCGKGLLVENNIEYGLLNDVCYQDCVDKLGRLEAIENELGINLFTFVKVLKAPEIYFKRENEILEIPHCDILWDIAVNSIAIVLEEDKNHTLYSIYYLRDYGKTWALTKEELL